MAVAGAARGAGGRVRIDAADAAAPAPGRRRGLPRAGRGRAGAAGVVVRGMATGDGRRQPPGDRAGAGRRAGQHRRAAPAPRARSAGAGQAGGSRKAAERALCELDEEDERDDDEDDDNASFLESDDGVDDATWLASLPVVEAEPGREAERRRKLMEIKFRQNRRLFAAAPLARIEKHLVCADPVAYEEWFARQPMPRAKRRVCGAGFPDSGLN